MDEARQNMHIIKPNTMTLVWYQK